MSVVQIALCFFNIYVKEWIFTDWRCFLIIHTENAYNIFQYSVELLLLPPLKYSHSVFSLLTMDGKIFISPLSTALPLIQCLTVVTYHSYIIPTWAAFFDVSFRLLFCSTYEKDVCIFTIIVIDIIHYYYIKLASTYIEFVVFHSISNPFGFICLS